MIPQIACTGNNIGAATMEAWLDYARKPAITVQLHLIPIPPSLQQKTQVNILVYTNISRCTFNELPLNYAFLILKLCVSPGYWNATSPTSSTSANTISTSAVEGKQLTICCYPCII